jgi:phage protein D
VRQPRGLIRVNGNLITGWTEFEVTSNSLYKADEFEATLSLRNAAPGLDWTWWASQQVLTVEIYAGVPQDPTRYDANDLTQLIVGNADLVDTDPVMGTVHLTGRDNTALLIDTKTDQKYQNLTASQIATQLAEAAGLTANVTATTTKAGVYYNIDHVLPSTERSQWDLLTYLAQREEFTVGVSGNTLTFGPLAPDQTVYPINWIEPDPVLPQANVPRIGFSHNLTLARDVVVKVRSWNAAQKQAFTKTATVKHKSGSPGQPQTYSIVKPGLTPDQAQQLAQSMALNISLHEIRMRLDNMPGDGLPTTQQALELTGTPYDQTFYPEKITRRFSSGSYVMDIESKNVRPESEVLV